MVEAQVTFWELMVFIVLFSGGVLVWAYREMTKLAKQEQHDESKRGVVRDDIPAL